MFNGLSEKRAKMHYWKDKFNDNVVQDSVDILLEVFKNVGSVITGISLIYYNLLKSTVVMESKTIYIVVVLQLSVSLTWKFNGNVILK